MRTMSNLDESTFSSWILVFVRVVFLAQFFVRMLDVSVRRRPCYLEDLVEICCEREC